MRSKLYSRITYTIFALAAMSFSIAAAGQGAGFWHTSGNLILDANNQRVRIAGINWYGLETATATPGGLYAQDYKIILANIKAQGYNTVRIPFSSQMIETPATNLDISSYNQSGPINTDLQGLNSLQVLDKIVAYAGSINLKIILDNHRSEAGDSAEANGLWFTSEYPESAWIADWKMLAQRYLSQSTVIGFDLRDEPHNAYSGGACWDCGGANDWHLAAERAGNAILSVNPNLLIFVEGTDAYANDYYWWGGNLEGVAASPVVLSVPNQLVYSAHDYGPHEWAQTWFNGNTTYATLSAVWTKHWAYINQNNIAPVWLGEFGTPNAASDAESNTQGSQGQWFSGLVQYLGADSSLNWTYWALNGEDSYGLLDSTYENLPLSALKQSELASIQFPLNIGSGSTVLPGSPSSVVATATSATQITLSWAQSTSHGVSYALYGGIDSANLSKLLGSGITATTYQVSNLNAATTYFFVIKAVSASGFSAASNIASATTSALAVQAPTGLVGSSSTPTRIDLNWTGYTNANGTYSIYGGLNSNPTTLIASNIVGTYYPVLGLTAATTYYFKVVAIQNGASSLPSNEAAVTTLSTAAPPTPSNLTASSVSSSQIDLSWSSSTGSGVTYTLYSSMDIADINNVVASGLSGTGYAVNGLKDSTTYYFTVRATNNAGNSGTSGIAMALTLSPPPSAPSGISATSTSSSQINLAWSAVAGTNVTYSLYSGTAPGTITTPVISGITTTGYSVQNLNADTTYYFALKAVSSSGISPLSIAATAKTQTLPPPPVTAPPNGLSGIATSPSQINLTWTASATSAATYSLYVGTGSGPMNLSSSGIGATSYQVTGLQPSTTYYFAVSAVASTGPSVLSNQVSIVTLSPPAPGSPSGLNAVSTSPTQVALTWAPSTTPNVSYTVYSGTSAGALSTVVATGLNTQSFQVGGLNGGTVYYFTVTAVAANMSSAPSNVASAITQTAVTPSAPSSLVATATSSSQVSLQWAGGGSRGVTYSVFSGTAIGAETTMLISGLTGTNYVATSLTPGTDFYFIVKANVAGATSVPSNEATAKTKALSYCHVEYSDANDWGFGFTGGISITNNSANTMNSWIVSWTYGGTQSISQSWNGDFVQNGQNVSIANAAWNSSIPAGATQSNIGFNAKYSGANTSPLVFFVNGQRCD